VVETFQENLVIAANVARFSRADHFPDAGRRSILSGVAPENRSSTEASAFQADDLRFIKRPQYVLRSLVTYADLKTAPGKTPLRRRADEQTEQHFCG